MPPFNVPLPLLTDSYKTTHTFLYPEALKMVAYGEFRSGYDRDKTDTRILFCGIRYIIENYVAVRYTVDDVERAAAFFSTHNAAASPFPFPKELFLKFVHENDGYFPVKIAALREGSVVYPHVPVYQITAEKEYARLVTYLETLLTMVWYPTTVATLSRRCRDVIERAYHDTVDDFGMWSLDSRLHDFGFRGCTSVEQSIIGGTAHLINFEGTDTLTAAWYAQYHLNGGKPVGFSIPATEHSIMTAHRNEKMAMTQLLEQFGSGVCACVMDSYDYTAALEKVLPSVAAIKVEKGGFLVLRPDSGEPVEVVLQALRAADSIFGSDVNQKGYKVLRGVGVIQGDGINITTLAKIADAVKAAGYAAQNCAYGMGAGLLQKLNRDTMSFATKLCKIVYMDGSERNVMKMPKSEASKNSLPGEFKVIRNDKSLPVVYPVEAPVAGADELIVVYDHGKTPEWDSFTTVRERARREWTQSAKVFDPISDELKAKMERTKAAQLAANEA
ncbi:nicotinate phosphoribosyltransferase family-domain-containing protein [Entophlyctis helioformis]|nr:nicotinate phosphoribosyltransferase family-domain-containing protein [Entophlyctis helioformis]